MLITLLILLLSAVFFVNGKIRSDIVALCALVALLLFHILTPDEALSGFSNNVVIMMVGLFVVGGAILQTGLAKMISARILKLAGESELRLFVLIMLVTAAIGAFVSNTGTVALMLPIVVSMAAGAGVNSSRLLMPLAFASSMGGMMTLIGTPPNLVIQNTLTAAGYEPLSFFSFLPVGLVCLAVGLLVLLPLSKWVLAKRGQKRGDRHRSGKSLSQLVREYGLSSNLFRLQVPGGSEAEGRTIVDLDIRRRYGLDILEVRRGDISQHRFLKTITQKLADPETALQGGDILYVKGDFDQVKLLADDYRLALIDGHTTEEAASTSNVLDFYDIGIAEILVMPTAHIVNRQVKEAGFRDKFNVNVLGIRRKKEYLLNDLGREAIHGGDVLLVQGTWENIARLEREDADWVVLGQPLAEAARVTLDYKAPVAAGTHGRHDGVRLYPRGAGDGGDDCRPPDGAHGVFPQRGGCLQDHQLGEHRAHCRHAAHVAGAGEDRGERLHLQHAGERTGQLRSHGAHGRHLLHDLADDDVHQQHRHGRPAGTHRAPQCGGSRRESRALPLRSDPGRQHVLCLSVLHAAQRVGDACRTVYLHGLHQGGPSATSHHGHRDDIRAPAAVPVLTIDN